MRANSSNSCELQRVLTAGRSMNESSAWKYGIVLGLWALKSRSTALWTMCKGLKQHNTQKKISGVQHQPNDLMCNISLQYVARANVNDAGVQLGHYPTFLVTQSASGLCLWSRSVREPVSHRSETFPIRIPCCVLDPHTCLTREPVAEVVTLFEKEALQIPFDGHLFFILHTLLLHMHWILFYICWSCIVYNYHVDCKEKWA